jgi:aspartyl-tRNA(Asn)/glutamyl-tRNA(Gln) amidotransferase subunit A
MTDEICFAAATALAAGIRKGEFSCAEVASAFLRRIESRNAALHAFITVTGDRALQEAKARDAANTEQKAAAMLLGVPIAIKDLIDVAGVPTTGGSRVLHDNVPEADAPVVAGLAGAGAVMLGKANLHEFAYGATGENPYFGTCVNAYDSLRLACGSSSGSAAAVSSGLAAAALGTDTGGSVRIPAVLNGLVGIKPTYDLVPAGGIVPFSWLLDHLGFITRTVSDCAAMLATFAGPRFDAAPAATGVTRPLDRTRIGIPTRLASDRIDPSIRALFERVLSFLVSLGMEPVEIELPDLATARTVSLAIQMPEALSFHSRYLATRGHLYGADLRAGLALGQSLLAEHYLRAKRLAIMLRRDLERILRDVQTILTPAAPIPAPEIGATHVTMDTEREPVGNVLTRHTSLFNVTGHPALVLPCGMHPLGLPIGVQIVGRHFDEGRILELAQWLEQEPAFTIPPPPLT